MKSSFPSYKNDVLCLSIDMVDRANSAINNLMSLLLFNIFPTVVDILVAIIYFAVAFNI